MPIGTLINNFIFIPRSPPPSLFATEQKPWKTLSSILWPQVTSSFSYFLYVISTTWSFWFRPQKTKSEKMKLCKTNPPIHLEYINIALLGSPWMGRSSSNRMWKKWANIFCCCCCFNTCRNFYNKVLWLKEKGSTKVHKTEVLL